MAAKGLMTFEKLGVRLGELENRREATARRLRDVRNPQKRVLVFTLLFATIAGFEVLLASAILMRFFALGAWAALYAGTPEPYPTARSVPPAWEGRVVWRG